MQRFILTLSLILFPSLAPAEPVHFRLDKIEIRGVNLSPPVMRLIHNILHLEAGRTYPETSLKRAYGRVDRLPLVRDVHFQLERGVRPGGYLLRISLTAARFRGSFHRPCPFPMRHAYPSRRRL